MHKYLVHSKSLSSSVYSVVVFLFGARKQTNFAILLSTIQNKGQQEEAHRLSLRIGQEQKDLTKLYT